MLICTFFADLPELKEAQVQLSEFRKGLAAKKKAGKRKGEKGNRLGRKTWQRLQVKDKLRTAKEIRVVSAHIRYQLGQRANVTGHGVKSRQTGVSGYWCGS